MRRRPIAKLLLIVAAVSVAVIVVIRHERGAASSSADLGRQRDLHGVGYVGSLTCRRCHQDNYRTWARTFHRTMTTNATPATVRGDEFLRLHEHA